MDGLVLVARGDDDGAVKKLGVALEESCGGGEDGEVGWGKVDRSKLAKESFFFPFDDAAGADFGGEKRGDTRASAFLGEAIAKVGEKSFGVGCVDGCLLAFGRDSGNEEIVHFSPVAIWRKVRLTLGVVTFFVFGI